MHEEEEWEWPEEQVLGAYYVKNRVVPGEAPAPKPEPKLLRTVPAAEGRACGVHMVDNYSWCDDGESVKVYVPVPAVVSAGVACEFGEASLTVRAEASGGGRYMLSLLKLFAPINSEASSFKVQEKKERIIVTLRKVDPPGYGVNDSASHKPWHVLHYGGSNNRDALQEWENAALARSAAAASGITMPKLPASGRK